MKNLTQLDNIQGVLIFKPPEMKPNQPFSTDQSCPNRNYGISWKSVIKYKIIST